MATDKAKLLLEVEENLTIALAKLNRIVGGSYPGSIRELKDIISLKLKLESINKKIAAGVIYERSRTRATTKTGSGV